MIDDIEVWIRRAGQWTKAEFKPGQYLAIRNGTLLWGAAPPEESAKKPVDPVAVLESRVRQLTRGGFTGDLVAALAALRRERRRAGSADFYESLEQELHEEKLAALESQRAMQEAIHCALNEWRRGPLLARLAWLLVGLAAGAAAWGTFL